MSTGEAEVERLRLLMGKVLQREVKLSRFVIGLAEQVEHKLSVINDLSSGLDREYPVDAIVTRAYVKEALALVASDPELIAEYSEQFKWEEGRRVRCPNCMSGFLTPELECTRCGAAFALKTVVSRRR